MRGRMREKYKIRQKNAKKYAVIQEKAFARRIIICTDFTEDDMAEEFSVWLENLKSKIDIADLVASYVPLVQKGSRKWACCPFHHEKTPSFCIDEIKQTYHCYGCHTGGDAIAFVMEIEHVDFKEAIKILAERYHVPMIEFGRGKGDSGEKRKHKETLIDMMRETAHYYHANLIGAQGKPAMQYLLARGVSAATATTFGLGYSLGYNQLIAHLRSKGYTPEMMVECGLADSKDGRVYDAMAGRLIVPIINNLKHVIAFGGRVIDKDKQPKYKNSKETPLFNKSKELFGQHTIKKLKLEEPVTSIVMVEGYMDVISLYQAGVRNAMASMGTALTPEQAKLIKRYCDKVFICYDGDSAGQKATVRGLDILYQADLDVRVMSLPDGMDPDEYVRAYGKEGFAEQMMKALPLFEYKLYHAAKQYDLTMAEERGKYAVEAMNILRTLSNPAQIEAYIPIVTKLSGIGRDVLYAQYNTGELPAPKRAAAIELNKNAFYRAVRYVLYGLYGGVDGATCGEDLSQYIFDQRQKALYDALRMSGDGGVTLDDLTAFEETNPEVREILNEGGKVSDELAPKYFADCLTTIRTSYKKEQRIAIAKALDAEKDPDARAVLMTQLQRLMTQK